MRHTMRGRRYHLPRFYKDASLSLLLQQEIVLLHGHSKKNGGHYRTPHRRSSMEWVGGYQSVELLLVIGTNVWNQSSYRSLPSFHAQELFSEHRYAVPAVTDM